ncbi:hypothetical protein TNCT_67241 [Trichonephila clavata]|uniref:Uncharacterized protein n=1 Tax=Trichonephila clavata TaxID=2740835 RepID=A0A8X6G321_TRICU|nr:hypothetical protein TNCT_67241 [Trichonephila clavata]
MEESEADKVTFKRQYSADDENYVNNKSEVSKKQKVDSSQESSNFEEDGISSGGDDDCRSVYSDISNAYDGKCEYCGNMIIKEGVDADRQFSGCCWSEFAHYEGHCFKKEEDFGSDSSNLESEDDK